jgi:hypothetical protein
MLSLRENYLHWILPPEALVIDIIVVEANAMVADRDDDVVVVKETKETKHAKNGPKNNPNPKILPHLGSPTHRLDATAIDAANVEATATAIDATAIDAAIVEATTTAIDAIMIEDTAIPSPFHILGRWITISITFDAHPSEDTAIPSPFHILGRWITISITFDAHPSKSVLLSSSTAVYYANLWMHLKEYLCVWFGLRAEDNNFEFMSACWMC